MKANPGDTVRLTGDFLRNTGQIAGGEGQKRWQVVECSCPCCQGKHAPTTVAVDEQSFYHSGARHILSTNLEVRTKHGTWRKVT